MKMIKWIMVVCSITFFAAVMIRCGGNASGEDTEQQGKEYTSAYICPMHCEGSGSDQMGTCPVCGMDYVKNEEHSEDHGHTH